MLAGCTGGDDSGAPTPASASTSPSTTTAAGPATTASTESTTAPVTAAPAPGGCSPSTLALGTREGLGALGHALYVLELRNSSSQACRLNGYPAVTLLAGDGRVLAEAQPGSGYILPDRPPAAVSVAPGASAFFGVESTTICPGNAQPSISRNVRVTPPGTSAPLVAAVEMSVCAGQPLRVSPVRGSERDITA